MHIWGFLEFNYVIFLSSIVHVDENVRHLSGTRRSSNSTGLADRAAFLLECATFDNKRCSRKMFFAKSTAS